MGRNRIGVLALIYLLVVSVFLSVTFLLSEATTAMVQMLPLEREHIIVIDAGHGGEDGGATSCTGVLESGFNLEIALKLEDLFHLLGWDTKMIRTSDISVYTQGKSLSEKKASDLKNRANAVNQTENAVLISIHQNTFSDGRYAGAQVFYGPEGEGQHLAETLQRAFCDTLNPGSNRKAKRADGIYLMQHIGCTGVLVECGFLSNPQEEALLRQAEYQKKLCCVIAATVSNFLDR